MRERHSILCFCRAVGSICQKASLSARFKGFVASLRRDALRAEAAQHKQRIFRRSSEESLGSGTASSATLIRLFRCS